MLFYGRVFLLVVQSFGLAALQFTYARAHGVLKELGLLFLGSKVMLFFAFVEEEHLIVAVGKLEFFDNCEQTTNLAGQK